MSGENTIKVPFHKAAITKAEEEAVLDVLRSGWLTTGKYALEFEKKFSAVVGQDDEKAGRAPVISLAVNSNTSGMILAMEACGVRAGTYVITTPYTFVSTATCARHLGITLELAKKVTQQIINIDSSEISLEKIRNTVCDYFKITPELIVSKTRKREIVQARQITMYLVRNLTKTSLASIGSQMGGKDHATVLHACNTVSDLIDTDRNIRHYVADLERQLKSNS